MYWRGLLTVLKAPHKRAMFSLMGDVQAVIRLYFLHAALQSGLARALGEPVTREDLAAGLSVVRGELLDGLLDMGLSLGEIGLRRGRYRARGRVLRVLAQESGDGLAACAEAFVTYYGDIYREIPARLAGAPLGPYLEKIGPVVARFSRLTEPYVSSFLRRSLAGGHGVRVLDVGCGSGGHLSRCASLNPAARGVGLEMDPQVAAEARNNLAHWGLAERFRIVTGDLRQAPADLGGPFDLALLINALYYFAPEERLPLFQEFRKLLAPGGAFLVVCTFQGKGRSSLASNLNLATISMQGCWPLPDLEETKALLLQARFGSLRVARLMPASTLFGIEARAD